MQLVTHTRPIKCDVFLGASGFRHGSRCTHDSIVHEVWVTDVRFTCLKQKTTLEAPSHDATGEIIAGDMINTGETTLETQSTAFP